MKLEFVTKNEFYKTVVKKIVTITSTEKDEFGVQRQGTSPWWGTRCRWVKRPTSGTSS